MREPHPLVRSRAESDRREGRFDGVGGAQVWPVLGREVVEGEEHVLVFLQTVTRLWVFELIVGQEPIVSRQGILTRRGQVHVVEHLLGPTLQALG
jgi:hypothetical protein